MLETLGSWERMHRMFTLNFEARRVVQMWPRAILIKLQSKKKAYSWGASSYKRPRFIYTLRIYYRHCHKQAYAQILFVVSYVWWTWFWSRTIWSQIANYIVLWNPCHLENMELSHTKVPLIQTILKKNSKPYKIVVNTYLNYTTLFDCI